MYRDQSLGPWTRLTIGRTTRVSREELISSGERTNCIEDKYKLDEKSRNGRTKRYMHEDSDTVPDHFLPNPLNRVAETSTVYPSSSLVGQSLSLDNRINMGNKNEGYGPNHNTTTALTNGLQNSMTSSQDQSTVPNRSLEHSNSENPTPRSTYYVSTLNRSPSDISWIGSITVFLLFFGGIASGRLTDAGYFYTTTISGAFLIVFGTFMVSLCTTYWQLVLAQGICIGLGNGCMLTPIMTIISTYFRKKLPIAMGIAACGSVTGGLIFPSMARTLLPTIGFGWTLRAIGFIQFGTLAIALIVLRPRLVPKVAQDLVDWTAFRTLEFNFFILGCFFVSPKVPKSVVCKYETIPGRIQSFLGVFFGFFYLSAYARDIRGLPYTESLNLLLVLNGIGFIGRLLPSILARRFGTLNAFIGLLLGSSLSMYTWIAVHSIPGLYVWTVFYSIFVGGVQSLLPVATAAFSPDLQKLGSRMGIVFAAIGIGALIGSPISGMLISKSGGSYLGAQIFSGSSLAIGALFTLAAREVKRRKSPGYFWMKI
ncbi:major facilitator superfamily transporter protein [Rutstroemia sp. NJR-2017a BVV2]|nr:major facilitator superfamily transporter protein [Rutstroemia sp. NJR-2017a BVV2]